MTPRPFASTRNRGFSSLGFLAAMSCLALAAVCWLKASSLERPRVAIISAATSTSPHTKAIEDIKVGDWVLAKDPDDSGPPTPHRVVAIPRNWTEHIVHVAVQGGEVEATRSHPFFVSGRGWTNAADLHIGDRLQDDQGRSVTVKGVRLEDKVCATYNLTVEGVHTYYVMAGNDPVLVHNVRLVDGQPWAPMPSGGPPVPVPGAPQIPWQQTGPQRNGVPSYIPATPVPSESGSQPSASWDERGHWDVDNGDGTRGRYDYRGNSLSTDQAHDHARPPVPCP